MKQDFRDFQIKERLDHVVDAFKNIYTSKILEIVTDML